jgi:hypothetical protein
MSLGFDDGPRTALAHRSTIRGRFVPVAFAIQLRNREQDSCPMYGWDVDQPVTGAIVERIG